MRSFCVIFIAIAALVTSVYAASILEYLSEDVVAREDDEPGKNCVCTGPSCICCVDFNMTYIDLGGPGCVRLNYLSPDEGIAINVSYGDNLLHSETVRGPDPAPTCLSLFSKLAQMCARFNELLPTDDGLRGCVQLEPMLLGEVQVELAIGCFRMGPDGMSVIESSTDVIKEQQPDAIEDGVDETTTDSGNGVAISKRPATKGNGTADREETIAGYSTSEILAAVNDSAEKGIQLLTNWLGLGDSAAETVKNGTASVNIVTDNNDNDDDTDDTDDDETDDEAAADSETNTPSK